MMIKRYLVLCVVFLLLNVSAYAATSIPLTINLSENVTVTGTPRVGVDVGGVTRYATYTSGSGTNALTFTYTMVAGDVDLDGVTLTSPLDLNGGTIKDSLGNNATLTFTPPNTSNVKVNYPSLGMDFIVDADGRYTLNGTIYNDLPSFLTAAGGIFTRASIGTYFDSTGVMQTATANTPRFDYNPVTHAAKGILLEESRTNLLVRSSEFDDASWLKVNVTVNANNILAPDNTTSADLLNSSVAAGKVQQNITIPANSTVSVFVKKGTSSVISIDNGAAAFHDVTDFNLDTQSVTLRLNNTAAGIQSIGNGWYRLYVTRGSTAGNRVSISIPNLGETVYIWGTQLEAGIFPTSYIPTTTATVTRAIDMLSIPTGGFFNTSAGTFVFQGDLASQIYSGTLVAVSAGAFYNAGNGFLVRYGSGSPQAGGNCCSVGITPGLTANNTFKISSSYNGTTQRIATPTLINSNTTNDFTGVGTTTFFLGAIRTDGLQSIGSGHASIVKYYPAAPPNSQLQLLAQ